MSTKHDLYLGYIKFYPDCNLHCYHYQLYHRCVQDFRINVGNISAHSSTLYKNILLSCHSLRPQRCTMQLYTVCNSDNINNISCIMEAWTILWNSPGRHKFGSQLKHQNLWCEPCNRPCFWSSPTALYSHRNDSAHHPFWLSFEWCLLQNWYLKKVNLLGNLSARCKSLMFTIQRFVTGFSWWNLLYRLSVGLKGIQSGPT